MIDTINGITQQVFDKKPQQRQTLKQNVYIIQTCDGQVYSLVLLLHHHLDGKPTLFETPEMENEWSSLLTLWRRVLQELVLGLENGP
jgi:hypothetical protein